MKVLKRKYFSTTSDSFIEKIKRWKCDYYIRKTVMCTEIILDETLYVFSTESKFPKNKIWLFKVVKNQTFKWLEKNTLILPKQNKSVQYNYDYDVDEKPLAGTDINHAYWRIAYLHGFINAKTYQSGLDADSKALILATISVLGREKRFEFHVEGEPPKEIITQTKDINIRKVYTFIRWTCYNYMFELSEILGDDFFCWKTDGIYYHDTKENRKIVADYFDERNLTYKQLVY